MKLRKLINLSLAAGFLAPAASGLLATGCGANPLDVFTPSTPPGQAPAKESNPEIDAAGHRVESAKVKLDQARQQLSAAKAMLKACEAEFRAARADKEALALRTEARKLADASGLKDNGAEPIQPDASIKSFQAANPQPATTASTADLSNTRIQTPAATAETPATASAAAPAGELAPAPAATTDAPPPNVP